MAHKIHHTEAIILGSKDFGEANRWYFFLTPDFGLILARAQGVRELKSKLRGHLSLFGQARISLVRGREYWRLVGAEELEAPPASLKAQTRVASLLRRVLPEAEGDPALFFEVKSGFAVLANESEASLVPIEEREAVLVWRILNQLGYIAAAEPPEQNALVVAEINRALSHSQL